VRAHTKNKNKNKNNPQNATGSDSPYQLGMEPQVESIASAIGATSNRHTYQASINVVRDLGLGERETTAILGGTANRLFFFDH
jgi:hypothetical protein